MATRVLIPQPILPAGYEYLRKHGYEAVDGRGFTEEDIITDIRDCDALIVRTARITRQIFDAAPKLKVMTGWTWRPPGSTECWYVPPAEPTLSRWRN